MNLRSIHRLEAGAMLPDTGKSHANHRHLQSLCRSMDFYWRDLLYIAERLCRFPLFKYFLPKEYLELHNHYAGDDADLRIWREATAHPELWSL